MQENTLFIDKYYIENLLGSGGFGSVYKTTQIESQKVFAIKVDKKRRGNVKQESVILSELQALHRLEHIHSFGIAHRDLKPQQFLLGLNNVLYLVDYGLARKFAIEGNHIPYQSNCSRAGNSTYASLSNHLGIHQTRRDDIESLSYMAISLVCGRLPWQQTVKLNSSTKWNNVYQIKSSIPLQELCQNCPKEFLSFIRYARALDFHEEPDYEYLRKMLSNAKNPVEIPPEVQKPAARNKIRKNRREESSSDSSKLELLNVQDVKNRKIIVMTKSKSNQIKGKNRFGS